MLVRAGWRLTGNRALLSAVLGAAVLLPAVKRRGSKALFAVAVAGSVAVVGYLPSALTATPGETPPLAVRDQSSFSTAAFVSTQAVVSMMSDCSSCHEMKDESMAAKPFPAIPHKTEGWGQCSFCHAPARLAPPPESHTGLPDVICQACHQVSQTSPPSLGHVLWQDKTCSSCHRTSLDLPPSHDDRGDLTCALCHEPAKVEPPSVPHVVKAEGLCSGCHTAADVSTVEPRHADWGASECTTCHASDPAGVPKVPHAMDRRTECSFCHLAEPAGNVPGLADD